MRRFRYTLEAVLGVRKRARDATRAEELNARRAAQESEARVLDIRGIVADLEQQTRELMRAGKQLDLQSQELLARYLAGAREETATAQIELTRLQKVHELVRQRLQDEAQKVRALERHRQTKETQHARALASAEHKAQDELWMARMAGRQEA